jgi:hypothetical protein
MAVLERLIGVYHADGGLVGELRYVVGKLRGTAHCALCDITHARVSAKREWRTCAASFDVPFETVHLNERSPELAQATATGTPCVVGRLEDGSFVTLLGPEELDACDGDVGRFDGALRDAIGRAGFSGPSAT